MKIIHVPFGFFPDPVGGTEVYVSQLARALARRGHGSVIAAPGSEDATSSSGGLAVRRFAVSDHVADVGALYGEGDAEAATHFDRILAEERPDVAHLHAFTRACSVALVRMAHRREIPVVFTYHTPTVSCLRGTLMLWGQTPCDGELRTVRCAACALEGRGVPRSMAHVLGRIPPSLASNALRVFGRAGTALRFSSLTERRLEATRTLFAEVDRIVAFRGWTADLLEANGVSPSKVVRSHHAIEATMPPAEARAVAAGPLRVVFLGRLDPTKGVDVLIEAVRRMPAAVGVELSVYGTVQGASGDQEAARLRHLAADDPRIAFRPAISPERAVTTMAQHDIVAVPSQWLETGPLVVLEAFAAGVPVVGSALGGIAELVLDGANGRLVRDFASPDAWARSLTEMSRDRSLLDVWRNGIQPPPTMDGVAGQMLDVYRDVLAERARRPQGVGFVA